MEVKWYTILSYWIFIWFLFYYIGLVPFNPKIILLVGLLINTILFFKLSNNHFYFMIIVILDKIIPYYLIRNTKVNKRDTWFTLILMTIYVIFLKYNNIDPIKHYTVDLIKRANATQSPGIKFIKTKIFKNKFS